ncbi:CPBP family intramembrane glutamic endopeptidase [Enterococcus columbae]|uniref:CAAX prenyl protease 2/Lysostaphin resistance protein A-like domain-containing protein n=1 Tax=Enterococcus columbae DSM 7374 = ATCC 51263 TaxID=1121865 RepID=S1N577_9ENTE|nr:CPBP family intramembrane glutamic endopeptidase [Enterococcus columbae]EOT44872.1 hypothetical protein OMW_00058 [Enterococcus columbae DSM 7374 = ATCC 51263]EOW84165.1 hypothetical protein I568_00652 [Enterococcus columbae DSM 7374 = ATCC 51263]OJG23356.1 hypothetical protein RR47_GL000592 [Enterococcus columbae DSM 7374 = ATCC 51263]
MKNICYFEMHPPKSWWRPLMVVLFVFLCFQGMGSYFLFAFSTLFTHESFAQLASDKLSVSMNLCSLFGFGFALLGIIYWNQKVNKRPIAALGFTKEKLFSRYALGFTIGGLAIILLALVAMLMGSLSFEINSQLRIGVFIALLIGFMIQGLTEEVLCRGYLQGSLSAIMDKKWAIVLNAVFFAILHGANPGIRFIPLMNLFLFGLLFGLLYYFSENILFVGAIHSAWNFFQGPVLGIKVSGMNSVTSLLNAKSATANWINGGSFGIEGSILTTILGIASCLLLYYMIVNKKSQ